MIWIFTYCEDPVNSEAHCRRVEAPTIQQALTKAERELPEGSVIVKIELDI